MMTPMSRMSHLMVCIISKFPVLPDFHSMAISILSTNKYAIGDKVYFEDTIEPYIFLGMTMKRIRKPDGSFKMEYEAELLPPLIPRYPAQPIRIQLSHKMRIQE